MDLRKFLVLGALLGTPALLSASLYTEDFNADHTASWTVNTAGTTTDTTVNFYYDYSAIGVPSAPSGTGTRGLKMTCNNTAGIFGGFTVSPTGKNFSGDYTVSFYMWQNYVGPLGPGGSGTTQFSNYGIGSTGTTNSWIGGYTVSGNQGLGFGTTLDGGSASDYRVYSSAATSSYASGNSVYAAPSGAINNSATYYTTAYPGVSAPAAQVGLFPGQTGTTDAGETAFAWRHVVIDVKNGVATWSIDGTLLATVNLSTITLGGGDIFFGHSDTNAGASTDANRVALNVTLIDNIVVTPEPATLAFLATGLLAFRRRSRSML